MKPTPRVSRSKIIITALLSAFWVSSAYALPIPGGGGLVPPGGGIVPPGGSINPGPGPRTALDCIEHAAVLFSAWPNQINLGGTATLNWLVRLPTDCNQPTQLFVNGAPIPFVGTQSVQPLSNTDYALQARIVQNGVSALLPFKTISVGVTLPAAVDINGSTAEWKALLVQALSTPNTTVRLEAHVDMDLSNYEFVPIVQGVSIVGGTPCPPTSSQGAVVPRLASPPPMATTLCGGRTAQYPGPRLFTRTRPQALFDDRCDVRQGDNVHLSGFRLEGPHMNAEDGDDNLERGIILNSCLGIEISNMEWSGWSGAAIRLNNSALREQSPDAVKIHDNFIHHNQHIGGNGYGVDVSMGSWATIEHNVFDFNRHAVTAGTIREWTGGYVANQNLILKGGGYHGTVWETYTQQFDVHGNRNCLDIFDTDALWDCGRSGQEYWITNNAFQYTNGHDFKLRGTPLNGAYVNNNVLAHRNVDDAIVTDGHGTIGLNVGSGPLGNTPGADSFGKYGVCDFDGDGHDDLFLATGASWWYMSSAKQHWVYLNSYPDTVDHIALGDFDGTGRCSVFAVHGNEWVISSGGTSPWRSLGTFGVPFDQLRFGHFTGSTRMEIFRRDPNGGWWIISPGVFDWTLLGGSGYPLSQLRFGDFNGHGITDVVAVEQGHWSVSWGGRSTWQPLNPNLSDSLANVFIADLDGKGVDDIVRYTVGGGWEVSVGGRSAWQRLASQNWVQQAGGAFVGHFDGSKGAQILTISISEPTNFQVDPRRSQIFSRLSGTFTPYGKYAY